MTAKKYLNLEEAAQLLGMRTDEVIRLRERGELRGFSDRGTWKFKADDVEETKRRRQPDSNPDVPLMGDDDDSALDEPPRVGSRSDSDVRLILDDDLKTQLTGSSGDVPVYQPKKDSDSDVRLVGAGEVKKGSDSDVKLIKSRSTDSDLPLTDSDSDVRLASPPRKALSDSDSDVRLAAPLKSDSDVKLLNPAASARDRGDSGLHKGDEIDLDAGDSILLDDDSGIRLTGDSSLRLSGESGIQLRRPQDSGILLERPGDSGFRLADDDDMAFKLADDSGIKVGDEPPKSTSRMRQQAEKSPLDDDLDTSAPMLFDDEDQDRTDPEVPLLLEDEDDLMPPGLRDADVTQAETNVILFDDEEDLDEAAATLVRKKSSGLSSKELDSAAFEMESDEAIVEDILEADDDSFADQDLDEVFEAEEDEFEDSFSEGMSAADFAAPRGGAIAVPAETEWSGTTVLLLSTSSIAMILGAWMACDLLGTVFASNGAMYTGPLVETIAGLFQ